MARTVTVNRRIDMNANKIPVWAIVAASLSFVFAGLVGVGVIGVLLLKKPEVAQPQVQQQTEQTPQVAPQQTVPKAKKIYTREEIELLVKGRTEKQALEVLGMPSNTSKNGAMVLWVYAEVSRDSITNKIDSSVAIEFEYGYVKKIYFRN